jgi:predicted N-formylglutamate amidohydrolase
MLRDRSYTVNFHAEDKKRCGFLIEMRQNEVATAEGQDRYASLLAEFFDSYSP